MQFEVWLQTQNEPDWKVSDLLDFTVLLRLTILPQVLFKRAA
jgi:hypothetical protein